LLISRSSSLTLVCRLKCGGKAHILRLFKDLQTHIPVKSTRQHETKQLGASLQH
jgi:hypothetical protein